MRRFQLATLVLIAALLLAACGTSAPLEGSAGNSASAGKGGLDTSKWYRITNTQLGKDYLLEANPDNEYPMMKQRSNYRGQYWKLALLGNGAYRLWNSDYGYKGLDFSLDTTADKGIPFMSQTANVSGQQWTLTPASDGSYRLKNNYLGEGYSLAANDSGNLYMAENVIGKANQYWFLWVAQ